MSHAELATALAAGTIVVTPNNRLARFLVARHDAHEVQRGATAWPAARALPWTAWLQSLWLDALAAGALADERALVSADASAVLWDRIVAGDSELLDPQGAATAAADAWSTFYAWRKPGETFDAWQHAGIDDDAATFSRWAAQFRALLDDRRLLDAAQVIDALIAIAGNVPAWREVPIVLAGFLEWTPQQRRLLTALEGAGVVMTRVALPAPRSAERVRATYPSTTAELAAALGEARIVALADPTARIGIVIGDLANHRDAVIAAADDILCPEWAERADEDAPRPYDLSLGAKLTDVPLLSVALHLIEWAAGALPTAVAAAVLRSPYLPGDANAWLGRAGVERTWRQDGIQHVTMAAALAALPAGDPLRTHWGPLDPPDAGRKSPAAWAQAWRWWLTALGWPGDQSLGSSEWQARDAWWRLMGTLATLDNVTGPTTRDDALAAMRSMSARTLFQPEARGAKIQILGMLEAAGLEFDWMWITGMSAGQWPPTATPQPLLPLRWQRAHGVPRADAMHALAYARTVTATLAQSAPMVIASYAERDGDAQMAISSLIACWPVRTLATIPLYGGCARAIALARPAFESLPDVVGPALERGAHAHGGVAVVESQSACAFQAFARFRLRHNAWPDIAAGLLPEERGSVLHRALASFWQGVGTQAAMLALTGPQLDSRVAVAVEVGLGALDARRWRQIPAAVAAAERDRLVSVIRAWLDTVERERPLFTVDESEQIHSLTLGELQFRLRIDRVDILDGGGRAVIDYKAGRAIGASKWFAQRPEGTQLGMYALALRGDEKAPPVRAVAFGQMKAGEVKVVGLAAEKVMWPALAAPSDSRRRLPVRDWQEVEAFWEEQYGALASAFRAGAADVLPRNAQTCRYCDMQALCRIQRLDDPIITT
ncbi:MAG: PD-(D/E)XK nuclease family protein, partial [Betaproteobacteria bacterium]